MYRTIFVPALSDRAFGPSLKAALPYIRTFNAQLVTLHVVEPLPAQYASEMSVTADLITAQEDAMAELGRELGKVFLNFCADEGLDVVGLDELSAKPHPAATWLETRGVTDERAAAFARAADLVILCRRQEDGPTLFAGFEEAMVAGSGRPVLITPREAPVTTPAHPVIAWNGSREAAHALAASEPLLAHAREATVLTIGKLAADLPSADDIALNLRRKGIKASALQTEKDKNASVKDTIDNVMADVCGDLLVMGAYSHARWRETILGGVTKEILKGTGVPVLLAH